MEQFCDIENSLGIKSQMTHYVRLDDTNTDIAIPTAPFNAVYQQGHKLIHMLGLPEEFLLVKPDERTGRLLAEDIMEGGNFGQHSSRVGYRRYGRYVKKCADAWHLLRLSVCFPGEAFFRIVSKAGTTERIRKRNIINRN